MLDCELDVMEYAVTMEDVEVDEEFFDYEVEDDFDECGFNPYMGCYDFDCQSKSPTEKKIQKILKKILTRPDFGAIIQTQKRGKENRSMMYEIYEDWYEAYLEVKEASNEEEI